MFVKNIYVVVISLHCVFIVFSIYIPAVRFTFTPSPEANIEAYQQALYRCSVDHSGVIVTWKVNGIGSANEYVIKLGVVINGAGSTNSSLTIPANPQYNNTVVRCNAFGTVNNNSYFKFGESTLKIQGDTLFDGTFKLFFSC